jgi:hypothetical protein
MECRCVDPGKIPGHEGTKALRTTRESSQKNFVVLSVLRGFVALKKIEISLHLRTPGIPDKRSGHCAILR